MRRPGAVGRRAAAVALAGGLLVAPAGVADAADVVLCDGGDAHVATIAHTRVDGDLHVAGGTTCVLDHVFVTGRLVVAAVPGVWDHTEATLTASEIRGTSEVTGRSAYLSATRSTLHDVELDGAESFGLSSATVRGDVRGTVDLVSTRDARITGDVAVRGWDEFLSTSTFFFTRVGGDLATSAMVTLVHASMVAGDARIVSPLWDRRPRPGAVAAWVCASEVTGELRVARAHDKVAIGAHPDGDEWSCPGEPDRPNTVGVLSLVDNYHSIAVGRTTVLGDLRCYGNTGPRGVDASGATVEGVRRGQCA